jgi:hypothetical protein
MAVEAEAVPFMVGLVLVLPRDVAAAAFARLGENADNIAFEDKALFWRKTILALADHLPGDTACRLVEVVVIN